MNLELNLSMLLSALKRCWWKVLILALVAMLVMASFTILFIPKKYSSSMEIYIINTNTSYDYTTSSLLSASDYLINDYVAIIKGDAMMDKLSEELKKDERVGEISPKKLRSMISTSSTANSSIFKLSVSDTDPERAYAIASKIAEIAPAEVTNVVKADVNQRTTLANQIYKAMDYLHDGVTGNPPKNVDEIMAYLEQNNIGVIRQDCITINIQPKVPATHDSPNLVTNTLLAGVAVAVLSYVCFLILYLSRSVVTTEEDIKKLLDYPMIGVIPHWSNHGSKN